MSANRSAPCENSRAVHISRHNSETVTDSFPTSHQLRSCVTPNFPKMGFRYLNLTFFRTNVDKKALKVCYKVSLPKNFQQQSCSAINYLTNGINILAGDDPVPVKFGHKGTDPQREEGAFHISHAERCAVSDSIHSCINLYYLFRQLCIVCLSTQKLKKTTSPKLMYQKLIRMC